MSEYEIYEWGKDSIMGSVAKRLNLGETPEAVYDSLSEGDKGRLMAEWHGCVDDLKRALQIAFNDVVSFVRHAFDMLNLDTINDPDFSPDEGDGMLLSELLSPVTLEWIEREKAKRKDAT